MTNYTGVVSVCMHKKTLKRDLGNIMVGIFISLPQDQFLII